MPRESLSSRLAYLDGEMEALQLENSQLKDALAKFQSDNETLLARNMALTKHNEHLMKLATELKAQNDFALIVIRSLK